MNQPVQHDAFFAERQRMVEEQLRRRGIGDERLLRVMEMVPRHEFIPPQDWDQAYRDHPVPIGEGQTISQPYVVALMIEALGVQAPETVLEVGTGTGYQAAVLSRIAERVLTIERNPSLAARARENLSRLGYHNVEVLTGDGGAGLPELAPFRRIIVAAAAPSIPEALVRQLDDRGTLVIPVGVEFQELQQVRKISGKINITNLGACHFVPLIGSGGLTAS